MRKVRVGDKVKCLVTQHDVRAGHSYTVSHVSDYGDVEVLDDMRDTYMLLEREYVFKSRESTVTDITGEAICDGDTIAYAFAGAQSRHLALLEVLEVSGTVALCRAKSDGAVLNLGVFEERAIVIK